MQKYHENKRKKRDKDEITRKSRQRILILEPIEHRMQKGRTFYKGRRNTHAHLGEEQEIDVLHQEEER